MAEVQSLDGLAAVVDGGSGSVSRCSSALTQVSTIALSSTLLCAVPSRLGSSRAEIRAPSPIVAMASACWADTTEPDRSMIHSANSR